MDVIHKVTFSAMYKATFFVVHIEPIKAVTSLRLNITSTRPTISTFRANQEVYMIFQDHEEAAAHFTAQ